MRDISMEKETVLNYDKRIYLNTPHKYEENAGYNHIGGKSVFRPGYSTAAYVCCYCTKCGAELLGYVERYYNDEMGYRMNSGWRTKDKNDPTLGNHCPICGNPLAYNEGDSEAYHEGDLISRLKSDAFRGYSSGTDYFAEKANYRRKQIAWNCEKRILQIEQNGTYSATPLIANVSGIKSNPEHLKEYISHLIRLEGNIYAIKQRLEELYFQQSENEKYIIFCANISNKPMAEIKHLESQIDVLMKDIVATKERQISLREYSKVKYPVMPSKPQLLPVGAFDFIKGNAEKNKRMTAEYEQNMADYRKKVTLCDEEKVKFEKRMAEYTSIISDAEAKIANTKAIIANKVAMAKTTAHLHTSPALAIKAMLDKEVQQAEELLCNLASARAQLYSLDIVFGKYRDVVALSTFYEYLMAGRCTSLEGANGAYNLYESESRANLIITKLDDIVTRLDKIIDNQYTISSMMSNISNQLDRLNDTMGKAEKSLAQISQNTARIAENSEVIAHNTAVTAYYSKVNAELTNSMGYLMAYKL